jgi:phospholipase C
VEWRAVRKGGFLIVGAVLAAASLSVPPLVSPAASAASPVQHVVIVVQENHSFDNVLGALCAQVQAGTIVRDGLNDQCDGVTTGTTHTGGTIALPPASDISPNVPHSVAAHKTSIDNGAMDGFDLLTNCSGAGGYKCYQQYSAAQSPNLTTLAERTAVADRFFEFRWFSSWMSHTTLVSLNMDGFMGNIPKGGTKQGKGWGCDSGLTAKWQAGPNRRFIEQPACIPDTAGQLGPLWPNGSRVQPVPTLLDRMTSAGLSWKIYGGYGPSGGGAYGWTICPTFWQCLGHTDELSNFKKAANFLTDARDGTLPAVSIVTPLGNVSQHNSTSWIAGDNWIGSLVQAVEDGGLWPSTTFFITYDDCGCFYDHVAPPRPELGIRLPMVVAGAYVRAGYTESATTTWANVAAYIESRFPTVLPINDQDAGAYDFAGTFDYTQAPLPPPVMRTTALPKSSIAYVKAHPYSGADDAT